MPSTPRSRWRGGRCRVGRAEVRCFDPQINCGSQGGPCDPSTKNHAEELQRRHYSEATTRYYLRKVEAFARHFHCSTDRLGRQHIREYQAYLFTKRKLSPGSVTNHLCALRFFYIQTLKRPWSIADTPYPKKVHRLPTILSQEEVTQLIDAAPTSCRRIVDFICLRDELAINIFGDVAIPVAGGFRISNHSEKERCDGGG